MDVLELAKKLDDGFCRTARVFNVILWEDWSADRVLGGVLESSYPRIEVQQEPETAHGAVEQMQQVLDQVLSGNRGDPAHDQSESEHVQSLLE